MPNTPRLFHDKDAVRVEFTCECGRPHVVRIGHDRLREVSRTVLYSMPGMKTARVPTFDDPLAAEIDARKRGA